MTIGERLREASAELADVSETPMLDAELLLSHAVGWSRAKLLAERRSELPHSNFDGLLTRRMNYEPLAYIFGEWGFFSKMFEVHAPLLVPRPETEHLVEAAIRFLASSPRRRVLDLCTGTGCVAIAIAANAPEVQMTATDINPEALVVTQRNAVRHGVNLECLHGDLFHALRREHAPFDLIVSNPPYVRVSDWQSLSPVITRHEDSRALLAGEDGLDVVRDIISQAPHWLAPNGMLAMEIGDEQGQAVRALMEEAGLKQVAVQQDLAGHDRIVTGRARPS